MKIENCPTHDRILQALIIIMEYKPIEKYVDDSFFRGSPLNKKTASKTTSKMTGRFEKSSLV